MIDGLLKMNDNLRIFLFLGIFFINFILIFVFYDTLWYLFLILSFASIGLLIYTNIQQDKRTAISLMNSLDVSLKNNKFEADDSHISDDFLTGIAINYIDSKIALLRRSVRNKEFEVRIFGFEDVIESAIKENGETITKTSKGAIIGGAVLAGGIGAVIGGLAGNKTSNEQVKRITFQVIVNDLVEPVYEINFLNAQFPISKNDSRSEYAYRELDKWHKRMSVIIKRNEELNS